MPTHIFAPFTPEELRAGDPCRADSLHKGAKLLKVPVVERSPMYSNYGPGALLESDTRLYDLATDPGQENPIDDRAVERRLEGLMARLMARNEAPPEAFARHLASPSPGPAAE